MRLLVVEDYAKLRGRLGQTLREAGFAVDLAADGADALWHAAETDYDVILLDLMLPKVDGFAVLERLRNSGGEQHVIVMTAKDAIADRVRGLESGADDYIVKPFAFEELLARVNALVRRRYQNKSPVVRVADLVVNRRTRTVERGGRAISLTGKQYSLLEILALRAGEVVTRADIWEHLYEFYEEPRSNLLDVHVAQLRRKLEAPGEARILDTVRGVGYRLTGAS